MNKLIINIPNDLTIEQYILLYLLYIQDTFFNNYSKRKNTNDDIRHLIKNNYIILFGTIDNINNFIVTEKTRALFKEDDVIDTIALAKEIFFMYPIRFGDNLQFQGRAFSIDSFVEQYNKIINNDIEKHKEIKTLLQWALDNNKINRNIKNWLGSRQFEEWKEELKEIETYAQKTKYGENEF